MEEIDAIGDYHTIDGAARKLGVTHWAVYGYIRRNKVPTVRLGGKTTLVKLSELEALRRSKQK